MDNHNSIDTIVKYKENEDGTIRVLLFNADGTMKNGENVCIEHLEYNCEDCGTVEEDIEEPEEECLECFHNPCTCIEDNVYFYMDILHGAEGNNSLQFIEYEITNYNEFELIGKVNSSDLSLHTLISHGLRMAPQGPQRIQGDLLHYIQSVFDK